MIGIMDKVLQKCLLGFLLAALLLLVAFPKDEFWEKNCFIAIENGQVVTKRGDCLKRESPYCTFNIVLSLIGFDQGVLKDEFHPVWPYKKGYVADFDNWKQDHNPTLWREHSCVWYSRLLAEEIGIKTLQEYVDGMTYGNRDLSGDEGLDNALTQSWMESSLEISPYEQVWFIHKMLNKEFAIREHAYEMTKRILYNNQLKDDWALYGKLGNGYQLSADRQKKLRTQSGWFVGWIEKGDRKIVFAALKKEQRPQRELVFKRARRDAIEALYEILDEDG